MFYRLIRSATIRQLSDMPKIAQYCVQLNTVLREIGIQAQVGQQLFGDKQRIVWTVDVPTLQALQEQRSQMAQNPRFLEAVQHGRELFVEGKLHDAVVEVWGDMQQQPTVSQFGGSTGTGSNASSTSGIGQSSQLQTPYTSGGQGFGGSGSGSRP